MSIDLADYIESLKREVTPLGTTMFSGVTSSQWLGYLTDAFWEARLHGFMVGYQADEDGEITPVSGTTDLPLQYVALCVLYAGVKILRNKVLNTQTKFRAKAGPVEFEQEAGATMLAEMLKSLQATKDQVLEELNDAEATSVLVLDGYSTRLFSPASYYGAPELAGG